jgi:hypothetical protein
MTAPTAADSAEPKDRGNQSDDKKNNGVMKHGNSNRDWIHAC